MMYVKVIQGHWKWQHSIQCTWVRIGLPVQWGPYRFWDNTRYKLWNITSFHVPFNSTTWKTAINIFTSFLSQLSQIPGVSGQGCYPPSLAPLHQPAACLSPSPPVPLFLPRLPSLPLSPPSLPLPSIALLSIFLPPLPPFPAAKLGGLGKSAPSRLHGEAPVAKTFRIHFEPKKIVSGSNDFSFFLLSNISMEAKSYTWYYITNRQRQNAASLTPFPQTQWLLPPKSRVKIGLIPPFWSFLSPTSHNCHQKYI